MRFIRQIILGLAVAAVFVYLSVFSMIEYRSNNVDLNAQEDKLPIAKAGLSVLGQFLSFANKIPMLNFLPAAKIGGEYDVETAKEVYNKLTDDTKNTPNITEESPSSLINIATSSAASINFPDLLEKLKDSLSKDWSRP